MPELDPTGATTTLGESLARAITGFLGGTSWKSSVTALQYDAPGRTLILTRSDGKTFNVDLSSIKVAGLLLHESFPPSYDPETGVVTFTMSDGSTAKTGDLRGGKGASAYETAQAAGFTGTKTEWLASLHGGSAFQVAQSAGFTGTKTEWLASLHGTDGASAFEIAQSEGFTGTKAEWAALVDPAVVEVSTSRNIAASDLYTRLRGTSGSAITLTIPADFTTDLPASRYPIENIGAGPVTITAAAGVTLNGVAGGSVSIAQYQAAAVEKIAADTWVIPNATVV